MQQFMIGQYGEFDYSKFHKDFKTGFYGIEACSFNTEEDCSNLIAEAKKHNFHTGVHFPLRADASRLRDALFLSQDEHERAGAFQHIQEELDYMVKLRPEYVLFHYPKPVILDDRVDWRYWRFGDRREYIYESEISLEDLIERSEHLFEWLSRKSLEYHFQPILEFDGLSSYVYNHDFLEQLLVKYPGIKLCLDTARLHLQDKLDPHFDARALLRKYTKYAALIHLSNIQVKDTVQHSHYPALPELSPADGWAPVEDYLRIIREENSEVKILFEHRSDLILAEQLEQCYAWVNNILTAPSKPSPAPGAPGIFVNGQAHDTM
ncbi:sugar phosphate isomerase/epimerase [Paenibacillus tritici]|uniref:Sugar phosphate isomerase/epimerase n=1 Tax=Paenibacillus tritici TaxID=1873425 RepID=A0ABX2DNI9_9BACL|nr:TIM barrel protein [Paenibacillus tritici]NQX46010.1 sugar phosphate isomerase/epimerase [Paenibacillus tritici]